MPQTILPENQTDKFNPCSSLETPICRCFPYLESQKNDITEHGVDIHEDILDHQMDIGTISFDEKLVVDARNNRAQHLKLQQEHSFYRSSTASSTIRS